MSLFDALVHRLRPLLRPGTWQRELDEEVRLHLDLDAAQQGPSVQAAKRQARLRFGQPDWYREETRRQTLLGWIDVLIQDLRYGWRSLLRSPAFTVTAAISLALGIGANTAIFGLIYGVLLEPLALPKPTQLVGVERRLANPVAKNNALGGFTLAELDALRHAPGVRLASFQRSTVGVEMRGHRFESNLDLVAGDFFATLGVRPLAGRMITSDDELESRPVLIISEADWERVFARDPGAVGSIASLRGVAFTIVGVAPKSYRGLYFPGAFGMSVPTSTARLLGLPDPRADAGNVTVIGRLTDDATFAAANAAVAATFARCCAEGRLGARSRSGALPAAEARLVEISHGVPTGKFDIRGAYAQLLLVLMAGVVAVLLIACANVGCLLLIRADTRSRELAVRLSIGAPRSRIIRQLLTEALMLAALGGVLGFVLAWFGTDGLVRNLPPNLTILSGFVGFEMKPALLQFTGAVSVACVLIFGVIPAVRAARTDLFARLRTHAYTRTGARPGGLGQLLVATQVALALVLVSCAGLLGATLRNLRNLDVGFDTSLITVLATVDTRQTPMESTGIIPLHQELLGRLRALPGVQTAGMSALTPSYGGRTTTQLVDVAGYVAAPGESRATLFNLATPGYFRTLGVAIRGGRDFAEVDRAGSTSVSIVNTAFTRRYFAGRAALGSSITIGEGPSSSTATIVGVVDDVRYGNLRDAAEPMLYVPAAQWSTWPFLVAVVRTAGDPASTAAQLRRAITAQFPNLRVERMLAMEESLDSSLARERLAAGLAIVFAVVALGLAAVGLFGVVNYGVSRRVTEIGLRMALGASELHVAGQVVLGSLGMLVLGILFGVPLALAASRLVATFLVGIGAQSAWLLAGATGTLMVVAFLASAIPALRAARIDPLVAMRSEV